MKTLNHRIGSLQVTFAALTISLLFSNDYCRGQSPRRASSIEIAPGHTHPGPVHLKDVFHVVGLDNRPGGSGDLAIDEEAITLNVHGRVTTIPLGSILAFSLVPSDKPLIGGAKGKLAEALPYGVGFAVSMTRPSAETLSLLYKDSHGAVHGGVLVLPRDTEKMVVSALALKLSPTDYPKTGHLLPSELQPKDGIQTASSPALTKPDVEVALPSESVDGIPFSLAAVLYEDLIDQLTQSGRFAHVWRAGDIRITPETSVLHVDMAIWKQGSPRGRGFGPFTGATKINSNFRLEDGSGRMLFQGEVGSAKRMKGESLDVANGLAKHVRKALEKTPNLQAR